MSIKQSIPPRLYVALIAPLARRSALLVCRSTTLVRRSTHLGSCSAVLVLGVPPTWADAAPAESPFGPLCPFFGGLWFSPVFWIGTSNATEEDERRTAQ